MDYAFHTARDSRRLHCVRRLLAVDSDMIKTRIALLLLVLAIFEVRAFRAFVSRTRLVSIFTSTIFGLIYDPNGLGLRGLVHVDIAAVASEVSERKTMSFGEFVPYLREGKVSKVVFKGISPTFLTAYSKDGNTIVVEEGFPSIEDPLSPSGPTQAIALVQHTPGVVVEQDLSELFQKSKTARYRGPQPMLESSYPSK